MYVQINSIEDSFQFGMEDKIHSMIESLVFQGR